MESNSKAGTYRFMRSLLMFDLPVETAKQRSIAHKFVKFLKDEGFVMFQESIYVKLSLNDSAAKATIRVIKNHLPPEGMVSVLTITENQFASMETLIGEFKTDVVVNDEHVLEL